MAEPTTTTGPYRALLGSRVRAQWSYRTSFAADVLANVGGGITELATVWVVFTHVDHLGGLDVWQALLVFALANTAFAVGDLLLGHLDRIPTYLRTGSLDAFLLRPLPVLTQVATSDVSLRRLGRLVVVLPLFPLAWGHLGVPLDTRALALLGSAVVSGCAIVAALFVVAGALQFWLLEGAEAVNSITYGGTTAAQYPASLYSAPLRWLFCYVVPAGFVAYLPVLELLHLPGPSGLPPVLGWFSSIAAVASWVVALLLWRAGVRHYTGTGS